MKIEQPILTKASHFTAHDVLLKPTGFDTSHTASQYHMSPVGLCGLSFAIAVASLGL
jgi:hypothetical protein